MGLGREPRQTTSTKCYLNKPSIHALIHGLNRHYYSIGMSYKKNELEEKMLLNLHKKLWADGLALPDFTKKREENVTALTTMSKLIDQYCGRIKDEEGKSSKDIVVDYAGAVDPKQRLETQVSELMAMNVDRVLGTMIST